VSHVVAPRTPDHGECRGLSSARCPSNKRDIRAQELPVSWQEVDRNGEQLSALSGGVFSLGARLRGRPSTRPSLDPSVSCSATQMRARKVRDEALVRGPGSTSLQSPRSTKRHEAWCRACTTRPPGESRSLRANAVRLASERRGAHGCERE
jgi:hypothetical protein